MAKEINVKEDVKVDEKLDTFKRWFDGVKHFITIKLTPPPRK